MLAGSVKPTIRVELLRDFSIRNGNTSLISAKHKKAAAVLGYILLGSSDVTYRERIAGLLWSENSEGTARAALRQCLRRFQLDLKKHGIELLKLEGQSISLRKDDLTSDIDDILETLRSNAVPEALSHGFSGADVLYGFDDLDRSFTAWLRVARQNWEDKVRELLIRIMTDVSCEAAVRQDAAQILFKNDPTNAAAARILIGESVKRDNQSAALACYEAHWKAMDEAWDEEPAADLQNAIVEMRMRSEPRQPAALQGTNGRVLTLGVRAFDQSGPCAQPESFIQGFRRELIASLVRFREWVVLDEATAQSADYVIETCYRDGDQGVRLTFSVIDNVHGQYLASETAMLMSDSWVRTLQRVIRKVSMALNLQISRQRLSLMTQGGALKPGAVDLWIKANDLLAHWRVDTYDSAETLLQSTIARDPSYAAAYSSIAGINNSRHLIAPGRWRRNEWSETASAYARRAVELDPMDSRSQLSQAWAFAMQSEFAKAEQVFELAVDLNPNDPRILVSAAQGLSFCGIHDVANRLLDEAIDISIALSPEQWSYASSIRFLAGRYAESIAAGERSSDAFIDIDAWRAAAHALNGDCDAARALCAQFIDRARGEWAGSSKPDTAAIREWFVQCFPLQRSVDSAHLCSGIDRSGLCKVW